MPRDGAGSIRKLTIEGISFRVVGDADFEEIFTNYENSMIPTSGRAMRKMEKRIPAVSGVVLATNGAEKSTLKAFAEQLDDLKISYTNAVGDSRKCQGTIEVENATTMENRTTIQILPSGEWTDFLA
jgi:hypothetical protein